MRQRQRGFALLVVLLAMGFLTLLGTRIVAAGRIDTNLAANLTRAATLQAAAQGAIVHAVFAVSAANDAGFFPGPAVREIRIGAVPVRLLIRNEADRVNINTCSLALMRALLIRLGESPLQAGHIAADILDWRTGGDQARANGAKTPQYIAAGLPYGPPGTPFQTVDDLRYVLGMTPELFARLAPHVTVLTNSDPDMSTQDPIVAQALSDAAGAAVDPLAAAPPSMADAVLRITALALGPAGSRYSITEVATNDFRGMVPRVRILLRQQCLPEGPDNVPGACS